MTNEELEVLGKRLVACRHFRPMRGMRDLQGRTWTEDLLWRWNPTCDVPDLSDAATLGCLLALVREATSYRWAHLSYKIEKSSMSFACYFPRTMPWVASEAEALVAALEAAP